MKYTAVSYKISGIRTQKATVRSSMLFYLQLLANEQSSLHNALIEYVTYSYSPGIVEARGPDSTVERRTA
jgi:hypothetical protein